MTAVDYLIKSLDLINWIEDDGQPHEQLKILDQALELEKEQIIKAFESGQKDTANGYYIKNGERYYDELYPDCQLKTDKSDISNMTAALSLDAINDRLMMLDNDQRNQIEDILTKLIKKNK